MFGKNPRKVDPRGQALARQMALNEVLSGRASEATVWLAWRPGGVAPRWTQVTRMDWPRRGVYFFREHGENRSDTGTGLRVVRVGTDALTLASRATLWTRLSQHRGPVNSGGGNHRGSIFRLLGGPDDQQAFLESVRDTARHLQAGRKILAHCAGIGRTGMYANARPSTRPSPSV